MPVVVVATFFPKPGAFDAVRQVIQEAQLKVWAEPGCELYALHEADDRLVLVEKWSSEAALDIHGQTETLAQLGAALGPLLAVEADVQRLAPAPGPEHPAAAL